MKVLMIGAGNPPPTFIKRQAAVLEQEGIEVDFLPTLSTHPWLAAWLCRHGFTIHLSKQITERVRRADVLHYQWPGHWITFASIAHKFKKKSVLSLRGQQINMTPYKPGQEKFAQELRRWLPRCDAYHCVSHSILAHGVSFGVDRQRARIIYTSVDSQWFRPADTPPPDSPFQIAMVGALIPRKGYEYALTAFKLLVDQGIAARLIIAGEGPERRRISDTIRRYHLEEQVALAGHLSQGEVLRLLQTSHIFLHTSVSEGLANSVIEAIACGLPVVAANCEGMGEAVCHGQEGFLTPIGDPQATADALGILALSPSLRNQMGTSGRRRSETVFSPAQQGNQFNQLYTDLLAGRL